MKQSARSMTFRRSASIRNQAFEFLRFIEANKHIIFIIACSKAKKKNISYVEDIYTSGRFSAQLKLCRRINGEIFVLSAKHGLVDLRVKIEPYDVTFPEGIFSPGASIENIEKLISPKKVVFLGGRRYLHVLRSQAKIPICAPLEHLNSYEAASFIKVLNDYFERTSQARRFYDLLSSIAVRNGIYSFSEFASLPRVPDRGVYYIFDPSEPGRYSDTLPRLVRIGTHAVSLGSKSRLRTRLRAHYGQRDETGNHRASIFRLHVGNAMINKFDLHDRFPSWGIGMSANDAVRRAERELEILVSQYISKLLFTYIDIADTPSAKSMRSFVEKASINLLTADGVPIENPTPGWLGLHSGVEGIRSTGLWNIQHSAQPFTSSAVTKLLLTMSSPQLAGI
jgi:hypothetical protein